MNHVETTQGSIEHPLNRGFMRERRRAMYMDAIIGLKTYRDLVMAETRSDEPNYEGITGPCIAQMAQATTKNFNIETIVSGDLLKVPENRRLIVIANHEELELMFPAFDVVRKYFTEEVRCVVKKEVHERRRYLPRLFAKPALKAGHIIPINREDKQEAISSIRTGCGNVFTEGTALVCLVDESRPNKDKLKISVDRFQRHYGWEINLRDLYTNFPKVAGIDQILRATREEDPLILDLSFASVGVNSPNFYGSRFHAHGQMLTIEDLMGSSGDSAQEEAHVKKILGELWMDKNTMIANLRRKTNRTIR